MASVKSPFERIAASLMNRGVKIGNGKNIKDADRLADMVEVACTNYREHSRTDEYLEPEDLD